MLIESSEKTVNSMNVKFSDDKITLWQFYIWSRLGQTQKTYSDHSFLF